MYFDSHAHLDDEKFNPDRQRIIEELPARGICGVIDPGDSIKSSQKAILLAEKYDFLYAAAGVHPHEAESMEDKDLISLSAMAKHPKVVAIGEIGLDYYYDFSPREVQKKRFIDQIILAHECNLPVIIHDRDAHGDTLDIIKQYKGRIAGGVMHCFSGSWDFAKECMDCGFYIALGGSVTFKNAKKPVEVAEKIPLSRLLIETDSPYLAPVPHRGERNDPGYVALVAQKIADIRKIDAKVIGEITLKNTLELFTKIEYNI